ncbi:MAG: NADH-quinone oxidoreductase subunit J [Myxococcota bacterium]|nr:NADH-quinone oxidoreductase subunit J [Myxococcota bacterium]
MSVVPRFALLVASAVVVLAPAAAAQPGGAAGSDPAVVSAPASGGEPAFARPALVTRHREESAGGRQSSRTHAVLFWIGFVGAVIGAGVAVASRTPMRSVLGLLGVVLSTAGLYLLLRAELLAAIQVIVYAGAVVVLFAFVIMFLQQGALPPPGERWLPARFLAAVALAWLFYLAAPEFAEMGRGTRTPLPAGFGTTAGLGDALFTTYLVPFEALSMLLLAAIVGAVTVARGDGAAGRRERREGS